MTEAFGSPGLEPTWTSSDKDIVTTAVSGTSRVWLTLGHGVGNEVYWPSTGAPQIRDIGFIVSSGDEWVEVKRAADYTITTPAPAILAPSIEHHGAGWTLRLDWTVDPDRDVVLIDYDLDGTADSLYVIVAPHLGHGNVPNTAWTDEHLHATADGEEAALAVVCDGGFEQCSVGFVGASDGWQDLSLHQRMTWEFDHAGGGNVALTARLPLGHHTLAVGLAPTADGATLLARSSLAAGPEAVRQLFVDGWKRFAQHLQTGGVDRRWKAMTEHSAAVLACHEDRSYPGAMVASLSIPWGNGRSDLGGYHLVWSRDCVESALARLAVGDREAAERTLVWLCAAQQADGHWTQNAYPDGRPFWTGIQLDEVALPIVLAAALRVHDGPARPRPHDDAVARMVRSAASYLIANGPVSPQDRWEEDPGVNAFTLATIVAALVAAAPWLDAGDERYALSLADYWNARIEDWLYVEGGELGEGRPIDGYYVRIGPSTETLDACGRVDVANRNGLAVSLERLVACDFLALVRFGLRRADDPRIIDTVDLIDDLLAVELPTGIAYRRYNGDGYGEHDDGTPFDGSGIGRPWPLLTGERGHYAAQAHQSYDRHLDSMQAMSGSGRLLPEQVWDAGPIPARFLFTGHPTGSAMPLAWAHAEFIKLATYRMRGGPIEQLATVVRRYAMPPSAAVAWHWRTRTPFASVPAGTPVLIDHPRPFSLRIDGEEHESHPIGFGRYGVDLGPLHRPTTFVVAERGEPVGNGAIAIAPPTSASPPTNTLSPTTAHQPSKEPVTS